MHRVIVPSRSGVHRFACLALYRALLRQCFPTHNRAPWLHETRSLVKQRFRRYKELQSPSQAANALQAGYKTLDLLHSAANGNQQDAEHLSSVIEQAKSMKEQYTTMQKQKSTEPLASKQPPSKKQVRRAESRRFQEATRRRHPDAQSILDYSQRNLNGRRKVPVLVNARGVPFLRFKKPQPQNLSGVLRAKLAKRWHWIERRDRLRTELLFAKDEDTWDHITDATESPAWSAEIERALSEVLLKIKESDRRNREMAKKMWNIVLVEREKAKSRGDLGELNQSGE